MDEIHDIVLSIVKGCTRGGVEVSDILAAFTAQTIIESNEEHFVLDRNVTIEGAEQVIVASIDKLLERDNPSLETMKMQVDYDSYTTKHETEAQKLLQSRNKMVLNHKNSVMETKSVESGDFATLTSLYRKIFRYLIEFSPNVKVLHDKNMDREIAAALESVFPRVGLKAFVSLSEEEKSWQLEELGRIILGIRLFNREQHRGGVGLENMDNDSIQLVTTMSDDISNEIIFFNDACQKYQFAIVKAYLNKKRYETEWKRYEELKKMVVDIDDNMTAMTDGGSLSIGMVDHGNNNNSSSSTSIIMDNSIILDNNHRGMTTLENQEQKLRLIPQPLPDVVVDRWLQELTNRRQYLSYLKILNDEIILLRDKIYNLNENIQLELRNLKALVSNRSSVPKEVVYPRFDSLGNLWIKLYEEVTSLISRSKTYKVLCKYRLSFHPTLSESYYTKEEEELVEGYQQPSLVVLADDVQSPRINYFMNGYSQEVNSDPIEEGVLRSISAPVPPAPVPVPVPITLPVVVVSNNTETSVSLSQEDGMGQSVMMMGEGYDQNVNEGEGIISNEQQQLGTSRSIMTMDMDGSVGTGTGVAAGSDDDRSVATIGLIVSMTENEKSLKNNTSTIPEDTTLFAMNNSNSSSNTNNTTIDISDVIVSRPVTREEGGSVFKDTNNTNTNASAVRLDRIPQGNELTSAISGENNNNGMNNNDNNSTNNNNIIATTMANNSSSFNTLLFQNPDNQVIEPNVVMASGAVLLSIENTPDFLLLPLELQGFCPWTIVHARGLLIPGRPSLGVVRYNNQYFVFDHDIGMKAFINDPEFYLFKIKERAMKSPEFIHLLRLQKWFPKTSITRLLENPETDSVSGGILSETKPNMKDVGTETPIHFIDSYIDLNYHWNEWELRRNALKIINLRSCITTSSQTDASHYKRDNHTQVYLPKENDTQTRRDKGINPPRVTSYVAGLRGKVSEMKDEHQISKFMKAISNMEEKVNKLDKIRYQETRPHVITLTTDF